MAFSVLSAIKLYSLLAIGCSCVLAETQLYQSPLIGLVRLKRSASPQRTYTFSGFDPNNGFAAFATSSNFMPYYQYPAVFPQVTYQSIESRGDTFSPLNSASTDYQAPDAPSSFEFQPPSSDFQGPTSADNVPPSSGEFQPTTNILGDDRKVPTQNLSPPSEFAPNGSYDNSPAPITKKPKKKPAPVAAGEDDDEDDAGSVKAKSTSNASFNAWFPIVLGTFPSTGQLQRGPNYAGSESSRDAVSAALNEPQGPAGGLGTTVIANSISHGKGSVASSHAIVYGGEARRIGS